MRDGRGLCEELGLKSGECAGMRNLLNGFRNKIGLEIGERGSENPRRSIIRNVCRVKGLFPVSSFTTVAWPRWE